MSRTPPRHNADEPDIETRNKQLVREHVAAITDHDLEAAAALHADDVVVRSPFGDRRGIDEVMASWQLQLDAIPDLEDSIDLLLADGDRVAVRYTTTGTHDGELFGIQPTGERIEIPSMAVVRIEDGQITEWLNHPNGVEFLAQLDVVDLPSL